MKKKFLSLLMGLILVGGSLTGCGDNAAAGVGSTPAAESGVQEEAEADNKDTELDTLDIFLNFPWATCDNFEGIIPDIIREKTGVNLNVTIATDANQLGVMIGSGELPDIVYTDSEIDRLSNPNVCISYDELEEKYGASFAKASDERKNIARSLSEDGKYYTLLNNYSTNEEWKDCQMGAPGQAALYYRKDLLGDVEIKTVDQLMDVLEQCKEEYPEMQPFGLGGVWKFQYLKNMMGVYSDQYNPETGEFFYEASDPGYKDFLKVANQMARKGYITAEAYANENETDANQLAYNNGCVFFNAYLSFGGYTSINENTKKINPDAEWALLPRIGDKSWIDFSKGWGAAFVSKNCKNPEAAARLLTFLHSGEARWGREGIDYTLKDNGVPEFSEEFKECRASSDFEKTYNAFFFLGTSAIDELYFNYAGVDEELVEDFSSYGRNFVNYAEVGIAKPKSSSDEGVIYSKMEELRKVYEAKVIFTETDDEFEAAYEEYMDALNQTGLQQYNDYMVKAIQEEKEKIGK